MNFYHFDDFTINLAQIVAVCWNDNAACANVVMTAGDDFDIDGENYEIFKKLLGRD